MCENFPNPETNWHAENFQGEVDTHAISDRIGPYRGMAKVLSGGLANQNIRLDGDRVLRIYLRDRNTLGREREILSRPWEHFRVPRVLGSGDDFLLLEFVEHHPLRNTAEQGTATGRALAEIHSIKMPSSGELNERLEMEEVWADFPAMIEDYLRKTSDSLQPHADLIDAAEDFVRRRKSLMQEACPNPVLLHGDFKASNLHEAQDGRLLVLDWEFAYAGPCLMDVGQLLRWDEPQPFTDNFVAAYTAAGGNLPKNWRELIACFDLVNLVGLLAKSDRGTRREADCMGRIRERLQRNG